MRRRSMLAIPVLLSLAAPGCQQAPQASPGFNVHPSNESGFATRLAYANRVVYTTNVEPALSQHDEMLDTVVRQGHPMDDGTGRSWRRFTLEDSTLENRFHTQPSIAVDREGHLHVAYNMHNMPWQYAVSRKPHNIEDWEFRGEALSRQRLQAFARKDDSHDFRGPGRGAIPGNQITYPRFFTNPQGEIYLSYRFAVYPARNWPARVLGGGLARYDVADRSWTPIGGVVPRSRADVAVAEDEEPPAATVFAMEPNWVVYMPAIAFDGHGGMHVAWLWRQGGPGRTVSRPSYAFSPDGGRTFQRSDGTPYELPIGLESAEQIVPDRERTYLTPLQLAVSPDGGAWVYMSPADRNPSRELWRADGRGGWHAEGRPPESAYAFDIDRQGRHWAFASGLRIHQRANAAAKWQLFEERAGLCAPWPLLTDEAIFVHAVDCEDKGRVQVLEFSPP